MTLNEYQITAHGYFLRHDRADEGLRRLYVLQYNSKAKKGKGLKSFQAIRNVWPLLTDPKITDLIPKEEIEDRMKRARALTASQKQKK